MRLVCRIGHLSGEGPAEVTQVPGPTRAGIALRQEEKDQLAGSAGFASASAGTGASGGTHTRLLEETDDTLGSTPAGTGGNIGDPVAPFWGRAIPCTCHNAWASVYI